MLHVPLASRERTPSWWKPAERLPRLTLKAKPLRSAAGVAIGTSVASPKPGSVSTKYSALVTLVCGTTKLVLLVTEPPLCTRVMGPVWAAELTTAVSCVLPVPPVTANDAAGAPPISTPVTLPKSVPVTVMVVPGAPLTGENEVRVGAASTVKLLALLPEPCAEVAAMRPVVAPAGTVAVAEVPLPPKVMAAVPLKLTPVRLLRLVPVRVTTVPGVPLVGAKPVIVGGPVMVACVAL